MVRLTGVQDKTANGQLFDEAIFYYRMSCRIFKLLGDRQTVRRGEERLRTHAGFILTLNHLGPSTSMRLCDMDNMSSSSSTSRGCFGG